MAITGDLTRYQNMRAYFGELFAGGSPIVGSAGLIGGNHFYVSDVSGDGGVSGNEGKTLTAPALTLASVLDSGDLAAGDHIHLLPGHTETVSAAAGLDVDTAGITIWFHGSGASRASITFDTDVAADMDIDAASVTLVNPLFISGIDALTGPIDVNSADFTIIDGEWRDAAAMAATDCIIADANADRMTIDGWKFVDSTTGTQKQSNIQIAGADDVTLRNIWIVGDFGTGAIENGTAWANALLENVTIDNKSSTPTVGILLQSTSSGWMKNVKVRVASGTTFVTANNDMQFSNCEGTGVDSTAAIPIGVPNAAYDPMFGYYVSKASTIASAPDALYDVTGIAEITRMVGIVTSAIGTSSSMSINTSTNDMVISASTQVTSDAIGNIYVVTGDLGLGFNSGGVVGVDGAVLDVGTVAPFYISDDQIEMNVNTAGTGLVTWHLWYKPISQGASVVAAA